MNTTQRETLFVDVILPLAIAKSYTYRVPTVWNAEVELGKRVVVQFGRNKIYTAIIEKIHAKAPTQYEAKYIINVIDNQKIIYETQLRFWQWIASYYMCHVGEVMNAALPSALKLTSETSIVLQKDIHFDKQTLSDKEFLLVEALEMHGRITLADATKILEQKNTHVIIRGLLDKKIVWIEEELEERYKPRKATFIKLNEKYKNTALLKNLFSELERRPKQVSLLQKYLQISKSTHEIEKKTLLNESGVTVAVLNNLIKKEILIGFEKNISRIQIDDKNLLEQFELSKKQEQALASIQHHFGQQKIVLLHGITSSGKTQLYIRLIERQLELGKQSLFLLPEIALTTQIINRLRKYFGNKVGVYHSKFNDSERVEVWNKVLDGSFQIILGTRSSLFLPFKNLGLIIVDEEHENSYKQYDPAPRYQARDSAIYLATLYQANVLLGSATPSLESYYNAQSGKYALVELNERYGGVKLPSIIVADLKEETRKKTIQSNFSSILINEIRATLERKEQVILFQNRRGYAPLLLCNTCGFTPKCIHCDVSLTYHKLTHELHCHYCGYHQKILKTCTACGSSHLEMKGFGTEKIEEELAVIFPEARIARMDLDSTRAKNAYTELLSDLENKKTDILIGTQMVAKGLDVEHVTLIGIINADTMLNYPDFRAFERSFQLMEQVSGRAGRRDTQGKVIIQTFNPNHYIIQAVIHHHYHEMYQTELNERSNFKYPPLYRIIKLEIRHKDMGIAQEAAHYLATELRKSVKVPVLGPEFPMIIKIRNYYINTILIKIRRQDSVNQVKEIIRTKIQLTQEEKKFKSALIVCDVDPM